MLEWPDLSLGKHTNLVSACPVCQWNNSSSLTVLRHIQGLLAINLRLFLIVHAAELF